LSESNIIFYSEAMAFFYVPVSEQKSRRVVGKKVNKTPGHKVPGVSFLRRSALHLPRQSVCFPSFKSDLHFIGNNVHSRHKYQCKESSKTEPENDCP
jgi:hypothetical protein